MQLLLANKVKASIAMSVPREVTDFETKEPKKDEKSGAQLYSIQVALVVENERPTVVKVTAPLKGDVAEGDAITFDGLRANYWTMDGKSGLSLRADAVRKAA